MNTEATLKTLCEAAGVGGQTGIRDTAVQLLKTLTDEVSVDVMGNVIGILRCGKKDAPLLMLEAHMDEIGLIVTEVDKEGFLHVNSCGGIDVRVMRTMEVIVEGDKPIFGVVCSTPPHLSDPKDASKCGEVSDLLIDVGMTGDEAKAHIPVGSRVMFRPHAERMGKWGITAKALDDRAGMATLLLCGDGLKKRKVACDVAIAFCVQEEIGAHGAEVVAFDKLPAALIAVDVSFGYTPDAKKNECGECGKGAMIGVSPVLDAAISDRLIALAKEKGIAYQIEVMGESTGTDADELSVTASGIPCGLVSVPLRFMHTPNEWVDMRDVESVAQLLTEWVGDRA